MYLPTSAHLTVQYRCTWCGFGFALANTTWKGIREEEEANTENKKIRVQGFLRGPLGLLSGEGNHAPHPVSPLCRIALVSYLFSSFSWILYAPPIVSLLLSLCCQLDCLQFVFLHPDRVVAEEVITYTPPCLSPRHLVPLRPLPPPPPPTSLPTDVSPGNEFPRPHAPSLTSPPSSLPALHRPRSIHIRQLHPSPSSTLPTGE